VFTQDGSLFLQQNGDLFNGHVSHAEMHSTLEKIDRRSSEIVFLLLITNLSYPFVSVFVVGHYPTPLTTPVCYSRVEMFADRPREPLGYSPILLNTVVLSRDNLVNTVMFHSDPRIVAVP